MRWFLPLLLIFSSVECLNKFLKHFEPLNYQVTESNRVSRSSEEGKRLNFRAYGREFKLILTEIPEKESVFTKDAAVEYWNETVELQRESNGFRGIVEGDDNSLVLGSLKEGIFEGLIRLSNGDEFFIESSFPYNSSAPFHSFIYSSHEVEMPIGRGDSPFSNPTGNSSSSSRFKRQSTAPYSECNRDNGDHSESLEALPQLSSFPRDQWILSNWIPSSHSTLQHSMDSSSEVFKNRICTVFVQIDHTLYEYVFNEYGQKDHFKTRNSLIELMQNQFRMVNEIFNATDFGGIKNIRFKIAGIKIWRSKYERKNPYAEETTDSDTFLNWNAYQNHDNYCLAYVFTYRSFDKLVQGLAFACYVCTKHNSGGDKRSLNTGLVSFQSNGNKIPEIRWPLTLAHEIGHNLGSSHDDLDRRAECVDRKKGLFIMFSKANDGKMDNHRKFSSCSIRNITRNLKRLMAIDPRLKQPFPYQSNCFTDHDDPICGNGIREEGEDCDCGYDDLECHEAGDSCCGPGNSKPALACKIRPGFQCSPTQGKCCDEKCDFKPSGDICEMATDCSDKATCSGHSPICPIPMAVNENKLCDDVSGTCQGGKCNGSVCATRGMKDCQSTRRSCLLYCESGGNCNSTASLHEFAFTNYSQIGRVGHLGIMKRPGEVCMGGDGQCDALDRCRDVVAVDVVSGSRVHGFASFTTFGEFLTHKFWILIVVVLVAVVTLVLSVVFCYYRVPRLSWRKPRSCCEEPSDKKAESAKKVEVKAEEAKIPVIPMETQVKEELKATKTKSTELKSQPIAKAKSSVAGKLKKKWRETRSKSKSTTISGREGREGREGTKI